MLHCAIDKRRAGETFFGLARKIALPTFTEITAAQTFAHIFRPSG
jgi:hypothetical protein